MPLAQLRDATRTLRSSPCAGCPPHQGFYQMANVSNATGLTAALHSLSEAPELADGIAKLRWLVSITDVPRAGAQLRFSLSALVGAP